MAEYSRKELVELKPKLTTGEWAVGGRGMKIDHFWPDTLSLCRMTMRKGEGRIGIKCKLCIKVYDRVVATRSLPIPKPTPSTFALRGAVSELVYWLKEWDTPDSDVMIQALWLINLAGVENSGIHRKVMPQVLQLMREIAQGKVRVPHALELMKGWEDGQTD